MLQEVEEVQHRLMAAAWAPQRMEARVLSLIFSAPPRGFNPAFVMTPAASADDRKRSSATAASSCSEPFGSAPT